MRLLIFDQLSQYRYIRYSCAVLFYSYNEHKRMIFMYQKRNAHYILNNPVNS